MKSKGNTFVAVFVAMFAVTTMGWSANIIPWSDSFEGYADGATVIGTNGWAGADTNAALVSAETYTYAGDYPLSGDHTKILSITADVTNEVSSSDSIVYVDTMLNARPWDQDTPPKPPEDAQTAAYVNTNGNLVVWHQDPSNGSNMWSVLDGVSIGTSEWVRLTFKMDYTGGDAYGVNVFSVMLNGTEISDDNGYDYNTGATPGTTFMAANQVNVHISSVAFSGTAKIDDFQYTTSSPIVKKYTITAGVDDPTQISIAPSGTVYVVESNNETFVISTIGSGAISNVVVDGVSIGVTNSYTFTNVTNAHSIMAYAVATKTDNNVPFTWMAAHGLTSDTTDVDGDGRLEWQEYAAGTDPNNSNSVFRILSVTYNAGSNSISYYATTNSGVSDPVHIMRSTDLTDSNGWTEVNAGVPRSADGTNTWWDITPPNGAFYKPVIYWEVK